MLIFDAHLDLAWNAIDWNRNLLLPVKDIRQHEIQHDMQGKGRGMNTVSFADMRRGEVGICIATLLPRLYRPDLMPAIQRYEHMEAAQAAAYGQMAYYRALEKEGELRWIKDADTLRDHVDRWKVVDDPSTEKLGFILSMEGADPILSPAEVEEWFEAGLRIVGPTHYGVSPYGHGTATEGGLFPAGRELLKEMERVGMFLDVTHLSDQCFDEAMELYHGPVLASHHNCRSLVPNQRQLTDDQIKRLVERGAVIGAAFDTWMLYPDWQRGTTKIDDAKVTMATVVDHMDHICQLVGNANHVAIGTDLDGGFGKEQSPSDLDTIADLQQLVGILQARGYSQEDIEGIFHGNWVRFFMSNWSK